MLASSLPFAFAFASVLAPQAPATESVGMFRYEVPAGWRAQDAPDGCRVLLPGDDSGALVRVLLPQECTVTPEAFHDAVLAALRQDAALRAGGRRERAGGLLRTEAVLAAADGTSLRLSLWTAVAGGRGQALYFAAARDEAFAAHRDAVERLVRGLRVAGGAAPRERAAGLLFALPDGWRRQDDAANGTTALVPDGAAPGACGIVILPSRTEQEAGEDWETRTWRALTGGARALGEPVQGVQGAFRSTRGRVRTADGRTIRLGLFTAHAGGRVETVYFVADRGSFATHARTVDEWLATVALAAAEPADTTAGTGAATGAPALGPTPLPAAARDVPLVGLWVAGSAALRYGMDQGGTFGTRVRSRFEVLALWQNGVAYRGMHDAQVTAGRGALSVLEGLAVVDAAALAEQAAIADERYARWREQGGVVHVALREGPLQLRHDGEDFTAADGTRWSRLSPVDGARAEGTFVCTQVAAGMPQPRLVLRRDGTFDAADLVHAFGGATNNPRFPPQGIGRYEFRKWTLILRFADGSTQSIQFLGNGARLDDARALVLGGAEFVRR